MANQYRDFALLIIVLGTVYFSSPILQCTPASIYLGVCMFAGLSIILNKIFSPTRRNKKIKPYMIVGDGLVAMALTVFIAFLCSKGYTLISWGITIVMLVFYFMLFLVASDF